MTTDLIPMSADQCMELAERVTRSQLLPAAYRGKPVDAMIAMMYGQEMGLGPMTALQRVVVINGKPTLDAQGMVALIRSHGHSIAGESGPEGATVTGTRMDTGDTITATFTLEDAGRAGLLRNDTWKKYPSDMCWARAVTQVGRRLFADVLMGASYTPEEMGSTAEPPAKTTPLSDEERDALGAAVTEGVARATVDVAGPQAAAHLGVTPLDDIVDAEIVEPGEPVDPATPTDRPPPVVLADPGTGELPLDQDTAIPAQEAGEEPVEPDPPAQEPEDLRGVLRMLIDSQPGGQKTRLRGYLTSTYGTMSRITDAQLQEAIDLAAGWPASAPFEDGEPEAEPEPF